MRSEVYKTIGDIKLRMRIFEPKDHVKKELIGVLIFLQGSGGSQFFPQCKYYAERGMVTLTAQFRVPIRHKKFWPYFESISDGKSAIRYIRSNASRFHIDPNKIAVAGASQGSIYALGSALIKGLESKAEDLNISSEPNALILLSSPIPYWKFIVDYIHKRRPNEITPIHYIKEELPPTILIHSIEDAIEDVKNFTQKMKNAGNDCELFSFEGQEHGFIKRGKSEGGKYDNKPYEESLIIIEEFLSKLDYLVIE
jgi:acetyl esterase/lipase